MDNFGIIAEKYDIYNTADYDRYVSFISAHFGESKIKIEEVLDLGCGTGEIALRLCEKGYSVTAVDISEDMLSVLSEKSSGKDIRIIKQDMCVLDLYGTVQACISTFDCLNYLLTADKLKKAIEKVGFFMEEGGIFIFDVNTKYTYEEVYDGKSYVYEDENDGDMLIWRSEYSHSSRLCRFYLTSFHNQGNGYLRDDDVHVQKYHSRKTIVKAASDSGFDVIGIYGSTESENVEKNSTKEYYILRKNRVL